MHDDEVPVREAQLRRALADAAPQLADRSLTPLDHGGTETRVFRLGAKHLLRVPIRASGITNFASDAPWLDHLARLLPVRVPQIRYRGTLSTEPALPWTVQDWIDGTDAATSVTFDQETLARDLASFIAALQVAPVPREPPRSRRGGPLAPQDAAFRAAFAEAEAMGLDDVKHAVTAWEAGLAASRFDGPPVWLHGDLVPGNLILEDGRLVAVIDWSFVTVGDPAYDLIPAWFLFDGTARDRFLAALAPDEAMVLRARARVAWQCVLALPYYWNKNEAMIRLAQRGLTALTDDEV